MSQKELHDKLREKVTVCWAAYEENILRLPSHEIFGQAEEIASTRFCYHELVDNPGSYSEDLLEHLLRFNDPLETMRDQWISEQSADLSEEFEHALWRLKDSGPAPDLSEFSAGGMTMG